MRIKIQDGEGNARIRIATLQRFNPDDLEGECSKCGEPVYYRPEPPYLVKFLCLECARPLLNQNHDIRVSSKTAAIVAKLLQEK